MWLEGSVDSECRTNIVERAPEAGGESSQGGRAEGGGLEVCRSCQWAVEQISLKLHQKVVCGCAAVDAHCEQRDARVGIHRVYNVRDLMGYSFQCRPNNVRPSCAARETRDSTARALVPMGGA